MRFAAVAAGFDGTLARDGRCDPRCVPALRALAATGRKLILVTARELAEQLEIFPEARLFDYVVAESGAVLHRPASRESAILARAPPEFLIRELRRRQVAPLSIGSSVLTIDLRHAPQVRETLDRLGLEYRLVRSAGRMLAVPLGVNKASGVAAALKELGLSARNLLAIGGAQDDLPLAGLAEYSVAVSNADAHLRGAVHRVTEGASCDGFIELARELIATDLAAAQPRRRLVLHASERRCSLEFAPCRDSLLISGAPGSGKLELCRRLLVQLLHHGYQCCAIGAHTAAWVPHEVQCHGDAHEAPRLSDVLNALEQPTCSVAVDLAALAMETRKVFAHALLLQLQALHERVSRPHAVVVDQAHHLLAGGEASYSPATLAQISMIYASTEPERMPAELVAAAQRIVALGFAAGSRAEPLFQTTAAGDAACRLRPTDESAGGPAGFDAAGAAGSG